MAGVKGRSGGARPNSGGARPGAGRKKKAQTEPSKESANRPAAAAQVELEPQPHGGALKRVREKPVELSDLNMLEMLQAVALGKVMATALQVRAAIAAVQYTHTKRHDGGKKEEIGERSKKAAGGRFAASAPPKLIVNNK